MASGTRNPAVAGSFYPAEREVLKAAINNFFKNTKKVVSGKVRAMIVPHAGLIYSGQTAAWGYKQISNSRQKQFVLLGPAHHDFISGLAGSSLTSWLTPLGAIKQEPFLQTAVNDSAHGGEHCLEVQLPFLQYLFKDFQINCLLTGTETNLVLPQDSILIVSSDLSHYLPQNQAQEYDRKTIEAILTGNREFLLENEDCACGRTGILMLMQLAKANHWQAKLVCYDTSATASGDSSRVVGYSAIVFYPPSPRLNGASEGFCSGAS
jgi:AmmeMemoRadiSam system protein B